MRKIGYVRVSSADQNPNRQLQQMKEIGMDRFYQEKVSGATSDRPELQKMLIQVKPGDTIYVTDLTRITRSTRDLFALVDELKRKQVNLKSLKDTWLDLSEDNPYSHFLMTVMGGVNQLELDLIHIRQQEGIQLAKKEGRYLGRVKKYHETHAGMKEAIQLYEEGRLTVQQICERTGVPRASLYRKLRKGT
ncbi:recombinase family protein [Bacillus thuringiensis]|uniref:recombinase family protein n=1 Tax=Bacillus thuringiensis TaxID=1428 RepID=UPI0011A42D97|nr:recombinase family protein [Bacillus thuringiensis]